MNFNSLSYLVFLTVGVTVCYLLPRRARNGWLLVASYFFYMCWNPKYALLMLFSTAVTFCCGLLTGRRVWGKKKLWLVVSLLLNLSILFFFKYFNFASGLLAPLFAGKAVTLNVLLPVGISFYIFQALGYTIDVYRGAAPETNFFDYALFVSFFPQLVAGPIERSGNMLKQIKADRPFRAENLRDGFLPVLWGLMKKMVIADNVALIVNTVYGAPREHTAAELALATVGFAVQIYCDFSAYTDIARGSAKMLGFSLMENFRRPYAAVSVRDFWRRWHISLSSWFRDYLYIPLGGSHVSKWRRILNLLIVFTISGLWHGAALTFVVWGLLNGVYQAVSLLVDPLRKKWYALLRLKETARLSRACKTLVTFLLINFAWVLFRADTMGDAAFIFRSLFTLRGLSVNIAGLGVSLPTLILLMLCAAALWFADRAIIDKDLARRVNHTLVPRYAIYFLLIALILLFGSYGDGFDPQDFVYFQF